MFTVKFKKLHKDATLPSKAHPTDVGYDVRSVRCEYDVEKDVYIYYTGLACETEFEDNGYVHSCYGYLRSSNCKKEAYLTNHVAIVDSDGYRGEIQARFKNRTSLQTMIDIETNKRVLQELLKPFNRFASSFDNSFYNRIYNQTRNEFIERAKNLEFAPYEVGDKCIQFVFTKEEIVDIIEVEELSDSARGSGGFGSTGA